MKSIGIVLLAIIVSIVSTEGGLKEDIKDIGDLLPKTKIIAIAGKHLIFDKEFKKFKKFVKSSEFDNVKNQVLANPKVIAAINYLNQNGANIKLQNSFVINLDNIKPFDDNSIQSRSVKSFVEEVFNALPRTKMSNLMKQKMATNPEFKKTVDAVLSPEFRTMVNDIKNDPQLSAGPLKTLTDKGVKIDQVINFAFEVVSWAK